MRRHSERDRPGKIKDGTGVRGLSRPLTCPSCDGSYDAARSPTRGHGHSDRTWQRTDCPPVYSPRRAKKIDPPNAFARRKGASQKRGPPAWGEGSWGADRGKSAALRWGDRGGAPSRWSAGVAAPADHGNSGEGALVPTRRILKRCGGGAVPEGTKGGQRAAGRKWAVSISCLLPVARFNRGLRLRGLSRRACAGRGLLR